MTSVAAEVQSPETHLQMVLYRIIARVPKLNLCGGATIVGKNFKKPSVNPIFKEEAEKALFDRGFDVTVLWDSVVIVKNNKRVKVKCNIDGNIVERSLNDLRKGKYACRHCIEEKWTKLAYEKGYKIVDIDKSNCKVECLSCGAITNVTSERILGKTESLVKVVWSCRILRLVFVKVLDIKTTIK